MWFYVLIAIGYAMRRVNNFYPPPFITRPKNMARTTEKSVYLYIPSPSPPSGSVCGRARVLLCTLCSLFSLGGLGGWASCASWSLCAKYAVCAGGYTPSTIVYA